MIKPKSIAITLLSVMWFEMCLDAKQMKLLVSEKNSSVMHDDGVIVVCVEVNLGGDIGWEVFCVSWTLLLVNSQLWRHALLLKWWMTCINNEFRTETGRLALTFPQLRFQETDILSSLLSLLPPFSHFTLSVCLYYFSAHFLFSHPRWRSTYFGLISCSTPSPPLPSH